MYVDKQTPNNRNNSQPAATQIFESSPNPIGYTWDQSSKTNAIFDCTFYKSSDINEL